MIEMFGPKKQPAQKPAPKKKAAAGAPSRRNATVIPVKSYNAADVKRIRASLKLSQSLFADYLGVSHKTVEAWEHGINVPSGAASRMLMMMEMDENLTVRFPFVVKG